MAGRRGPAVHSPGRRSHRRSASRAQSRRRWLSGVIDEVAYGGAELVVVVDERLEVAAVDDPAVLGGELAEAGHDVGGQLGQADLAEYPNGGDLNGAPGTTAGEQQSLGGRRDTESAMGCPVQAQQP